MNRCGGRRVPVFLAMLLLAVLAAAVFRGPGKGRGVASGAELPYADGEVLVRFEPEVSEGAVAVLAAELQAGDVRGFRVLSELRRRPFVLLRSARLSTQELLAALRGRPDVEAVSPNYRRRAQRLPDDAKYARLWGMAMISAPRAWERSVGSPGVVLALIDTGVDYGHEDLKANLWRNPGETPGNGIDDDNNGFVDDVHGYDFAADAAGNNDSDPMDISDHGTHVAGIMAAVGNNGAGVCGVNWVARIMVLKAFRPNMVIYDSDCIEAIEYALMMKRDRGVNVVAINASFGGEGSDALQRDAIAAAGAQGIAFVCAAGNNSTDNDVAPFYPAGYDLDNVVAVTATDEQDQLASFANYGPGSVDIAAPGVGILSTVPAGKGLEAWLRSAGDLFDVVPMEFSGRTSAAGLARPIVDCGGGLSAAAFPAGVAGNIALIERGGITFAEKTLNAQNAGAAGVVVYNNEAGGFLGTLGQAGSWVPVVSLARADGLALKARGVHDVILASFPSNYGLISGTSMACPHVTGALGLLAAQFPGDPLAKLLGRLYSGADRLAVLENRIKTGGRLNLDRALAQNLVLTLTVSRLQVDGWVIARDYAEVAFSVEKDAASSISGETYTILRKDEGGSYQAVKELAAGELRNGACTYIDKYLERGAGYTYVVQASSALGEFLALSNEQSI